MNYFSEMAFLTVLRHNFTSGDLMHMQSPKEILSLGFDTLHPVSFMVLNDPFPKFSSLCDTLIFLHYNGSR